MEVKYTPTGFRCSRDELDIALTLECGQVFRYFELGDGAYRVVSGDKSARLYYDGDETVAETDSAEYFAEYFDCATDYAKVVSELSAYDELTEPLKCAKGLRILRQQPFETVVSFIISANNNIGRIRGIIERLSAKCGEAKGEYTAFPTRRSMLSLTVEDYRKLGCGFRSEYLYETVPLLTDEYLAGIGKLSHAEAKKELCKLKGVGPKVAECILLFAYKMTDSYPVDTWIFKAGRTDELNTPRLVEEYYSHRYGANAGYAQQYIFVHARSAK